jgi:hypothetical protein
VLRLMPKVRQTAALVAPPSSAATTAASFSASIAEGRPPRRPRRRAAARPALTRSCVRDRSNCARAPKTWNSNSPCGVVVSICSVSERNAIPRSLRSFTVVSRCDSERPSRSSFHTTRQSPGRRNASALASPARSPGCRWHDPRIGGAHRPQRPAAHRVVGPAPAGRHRSRRAYNRPACTGIPSPKVSVRYANPTLFVVHVLHLDEPPNAPLGSRYRRAPPGRTGTRHSWRISVASAPWRSCSVCLCYKNRLFVSSGLHERGRDGNGADK